MSASRRLTLVSSLVAAAVSTALYAEPAVVLEQVVVTATKRAESIQDVPVAVSAITSEDIATRGFTQYADLLNTLPGVYFQDGGPGVSQVRIRGVSASEGGVPSTTASYFGEAVTSVLTNHGGKPNLRLVDMKQLENLGVDITRYETFEYGATQAVAAAAHFLEFDGLLVPSARFACANLVLFTDRVPQAGNLQLVSSETVDWVDWRKKNQRTWVAQRAQP